MSVSAVSFSVPGVVRGKQRPRFNTKTGRTYTPAQTKSAEQRVREAWRQAGSPDFGAAPVMVDVLIAVARPGSHYRVDGSLSAAGKRCPVPVKTPDLDNALKLVADALNGCAWDDDKQIIDAHVRRVWSPTGRREHVTVTISRAVGEAATREAA